MTPLKVVSNRSKFVASKKKEKRKKKEKQVCLNTSQVTTLRRSAKREGPIFITTLEGKIGICPQFLKYLV